MATAYEILEVAGKEVRVTNPDKSFFPEIKATKLDLAKYYLAVADHALVGLKDRPSTPLEMADGVVDPEPTFQKEES